jgi:hypothetical protein
MNQANSNQEVSYERLPADMAMDETDINLRAHFSRMSDEKLRSYDPSMTDEQLMEWDGDFRDDGTVFLVCSERDIEVDEYRQVLEEHIGFRFGKSPR